eukprot:4088737-Pyramimonas_sp.AAC.1
MTRLARLLLITSGPFGCWSHGAMETCVNPLSVLVCGFQHPSAAQPRDAPADYIVCYENSY